MEPTSLRFARVARSLHTEARRHGLEVPAFRSPPTLVGVNRSIRRRPDGGAVVAVVVRGRPWAAVVADMIDGIVAANWVAGPQADQIRNALWGVVDGEVLLAA